MTKILKPYRFHKVGSDFEYGFMSYQQVVDFAKTHNVEVIVTDRKGNLVSTVYADGSIK